MNLQNLWIRGAGGKCSLRGDGVVTFSERAMWNPKKAGRIPEVR